MRIYDELVLEYLGENRLERSQNHWLFHCIREKQFLFDPPSPMLRPAVEELYRSLRLQLEHFKPYNHDLISALIPGWGGILEHCNVLLAVGCPAPYDAMVRTYEDEEFIILDLVRFLAYVERGSSPMELAVKLLTHECIHFCNHQIFKRECADFDEELRYLLFDEAFAHYLAYIHPIGAVDFSEPIRTYYEGACTQLKELFSMPAGEAREKRLEAGNCGAYWQKFICTAGQLYLAQHSGGLVDIYRRGPQQFMRQMIGTKSDPN